MKLSLPVQISTDNQHASHFGNIELHIEPQTSENININIKRSRNPLVKVLPYIILNKTPSTCKSNKHTKDNKLQD